MTPDPTEFPVVAERVLVWRAARGVDGPDARVAVAEAWVGHVFSSEPVFWEGGAQTPAARSRVADEQPD